MLRRKYPNQTLFTLLVAVGLLAVPGAALAGDTGWVLEYYTYGGFSDVVNAFNQCALIFSSADYQILLPTVWVASLAVSLMAAGLYHLNTAVRDESFHNMKPEGFYSAILNSLIGVILFLGLVVPTGTLQIYDPGENLNQAVGGVPMICMAAAGTFNLLERTIVSLVDTSGSNITYTSQDGIKGVMVLNRLATGIDQKDALLNASLLNYISDCVYSDLSSPSSNLSINDIQWATTSMVTSYGKAASTALVTTIYDDGGSAQGTVMSCSDAWNTDLSVRLTAADYSQSVVDACNSAGYSATNPDGTVNNASFTSCTNAVGGLISAVGNPYITDLPTFESGVYLSSMLRRVLMADNSQLYTGFETFNQSNAYVDTFLLNLPIIRGSMTMALVVLTPFVSLLLLTKYWPKGMAFLVGGFAFIALWGGGAAIGEQGFLHKSFNYWAGALSSGVGLMPMAMFSGAVVNQLGVYKYIIGCIMTISGGLSAATFGVLSSISSTATASTAGNAERGRLGFAAEQQMKTSTLEGRGGVLKSESDAWGAAAAHLHNPLANFGQAMNYSGASQAGKMGGGVKMQTELGQAGLTEAVADGVVGSTVNGAATGAAIKNNGIPQSMDAKTYDQDAGIRSIMKDMGSHTGGSAETKSQWDSAAMLAARNVFQTPQNYQNFQEAMQGKSVGQIGGELKAYSDAVKAGYQGDWQSFNAIQSEVAADKNFAGTERFQQLAAEHGITNDRLAAFEAATIEGAAAAKAVEMGRKPDGTATPNQGAIASGTVATVGAQREKGAAEGDIHAGEASGKPIEAMYAQMQFHKDLSETTRADMKEKMAALFNGGKLNGKALMNQYGRESGVASMVLDKDSAAAMNKQLKNAHFQKGDVVNFGMGADGSIKFASATRNGFVLDKAGHTTERKANSLIDSSVVKDASHRDIADNVFSRVTSMQQYTEKTITDPAQGKLTEYGYTDKNHKYHAVLASGEKTSIGGKHEQTYFAKVGDRYVPVSGTQDGRIKTDMVIGGKAVSAIINPATGEVALERTEGGKKETMYLDRTEIEQGTHVTGAANSAVGTIASKFGVDKKTAEGVTGYLQNIWADVVPIAGELASSARPAKAPNTPGTTDPKSAPSGPASGPSHTPTNNPIRKVLNKVDPVKEYDPSTGTGTTRFSRAVRANPPKSNAPPTISGSPRVSNAPEFSGSNAAPKDPLIHGGGGSTSAKPAAKVVPPDGGNRYF
jgi:hypothetical protein